MNTKEQSTRGDVIDQVIEGTKPGVDATAALLTPLVTNVAKTGIVFAGHALQNNRTYRKVISHLI